MTSQPVLRYPRSAAKPKTVRRRFDRATAYDLGVRPFRTPRCALCARLLADSAGNPCWDVVGLDRRLVCVGGCRS